MQVKENTAEGLNRALTITIAAADLGARLETSLNDIKNRAQIKGFRPGKVPFGHIKKLYGKSAMADIVNTLIGESVNGAIAERGEKTASQPKVDFADAEAEKVLEGGADLVFSVAYEVVPEFDLADTSGVAIERPVCEIADSEVDERIAEIARSSQKFEPRAEGAAAEQGDRLTLGYLGKIDGEPFEGGKDDHAYLTLGSNQFIPGFEGQLVGVKAGEEKIVTVTFPQDYPSANLAGKDAVFECRIIEVAAPIETAIDDEWAKGFGMESLDKLKDAVRSQISSHYGVQTRQKVKRQLLDQLDALYSFDLPQSLVDQELDVIWRQVTADLAGRNRTFADEGTTEEEAKADYLKIAKRRVRLGLVLSKVGEKNEVKVSEQELQQALIAQARQYPGQERQVIEYFRKDANALASLQAPIFEEKVVDLILAGVKVTDKTVSKEELLKEDEDDIKAA